jgi:predicted MFS family arabinose efflux permease
MERFCPRKMATNLSMVKALAPAMMVVLYTTDNLTVAWIFGLVLVGGVARAGVRPILLELYPFTLPPDIRDESTEAHRGFVGNAVALVGALAAAVVYTHFGAEAAFALASVSSLVVVAVLLTSGSLQASCDALRVKPPPPPLVEGFRMSLSVPIVAAALVSGGFLLLLVAPLQSLAPRIAMAHGESPMYVGWLVAAIAAGGMVASVFADRFAHTAAGQRRELEVSLLLVGPLLALLGLSMSLVADLVILFLIGAVIQVVFFVMPWAVIVNAPKEATYRMVGLIFFVAAFCGGVGALVMGYLIDRLGLEDVLLACGAIAFVFGVIRVIRISRMPLTPTTGR